MSSATTSSLTQSVPSASRASLATRRASAAVWQPAVFGRTATPACRMVPSSEPSPADGRRRIATVVSSVPEAASTLPSTSRLCTPPVPTISLEVSFRSAIDHCWPGGTTPRNPPAWGASRPPSPLVGITMFSTSLYRGHDLDLVEVRQRRGRPGAAGQHLAVDGRCDAGQGAGELAHQLLDGGACRNIPPLAVDRDVHPNLPGPKGAHAGCGSPAVRSAAIASAVAAESRMPLRK